MYSTKSLAPGRRRRKRLAQSMVEYAIIAAIVAIVAVAAVKGLGARVTDAFQTVETQVSDSTKADN